jgi:hypothetical protein
VNALRRSACLIACLLLFVLGACASNVPQHAPDEVSRLAAGIMALDASIDPEEAQRAAFIAIEYPKQLRARYQVEDPPLIHNMKVNSGRKPRGLCWHWAEDMQRRIEQENFQTLVTHRAIANSHTRLLIDHSTVIVSAVGGQYDEGMVLDPWRYGGTLYWAPTLQDAKYTWVPRAQVFAMKRARRLGQDYVPPDDPSSEPLPEAGF